MLDRMIHAAAVLAVVTACSTTAQTEPDPQPASSREATTDLPRIRFESSVRSMLHDRDGNYWFGSWNEGVARFDGETWNYFTAEDGLSDNQVRSIYQGRDELIWLEGGIGISYHDGQKIVIHDERDYRAKSDWQSRPDDLWFKGNESHGVNGLEGRPGAYRFDGSTFTYLTFPLPDTPNAGRRYSVTGIARGADNRVWFATYGAVVGFDGEELIVIDDQVAGLDEATGYLHVRCVFEDSQGRVWIGNNGIGVLVLEDGEITNFTQAQNVGRRDPRSGGSPTPRPGDAPAGSPSLQRVFAIGEDRDGNIWFGTVEQGAWRYDGESLRQFTEADGLTTREVMCVYRDREGELWLGGHGVFRFAGERFVRVH